MRAVGNQANLCLMVREGYSDARLFVCPATSDKPSLNACGYAGMEVSAWIHSLEREITPLRTAFHR